MSSLPARPYSFRPRGLYDALMGDGVPDGACSILQNLHHDITTPFVWGARPAAQQLTAFPSFLSPGNVSCAISVGDYVIGMLSTARFPGYDEPFCYNVETGLFTTISGITSANLPATLPSLGPWTPPSMATVGPTIIVSHTGFSGSGSNFFGVIDISTITAPTWAAANTATQALTAVPQAVASFDNRIWYAVGNKWWYSDSLVPGTITNSTQFLTLGSSASNILGGAGLPIQQTQGGVLAALLGFKAEGYWQVIPDATAIYLLNGPFTPGTRAPRSIVQTPRGVLYVGSGGVFLIGLDGTPSQAPLPGVRYPFESCPVPSRIAAAYSDTVYRAALTTVLNPLTQQQTAVEYWFDFEISEWGGPHTISSSVLVPYNDSFVGASNRVPGVLYQSDTHGSNTASVTEFGQQMPFRLQSVILNQDDVMAVKTLVESQVDISFGPGGSALTAQFLSAAQGIAGTAVIDPAGGTYWNQFNWNEANWSTAEYGLRTYDINWDAPVVYKTGAFALFGTLTQNLRIGPARFRTQVNAYMNTQNPP